MVDRAWRSKQRDGTTPALRVAASIALLAPSAAAQQSDEQPSNNGRAPATFAALPSINVREHGASLSISSAF